MSAIFDVRCLNQEDSKRLYLSKVVEYISVSRIQDASSLEKKILTAIDSPFQIPRHTSPYLGINLMNIFSLFSNIVLGW